MALDVPIQPGSLQKSVKEDEIQIPGARPGPEGDRSGMSKLTIRQPDDFHLHVRDGEMLKTVLPHTTRIFGRAIIMPNITPPVRTTADALAYRERVIAALPPSTDFTPLMTLYLTDVTSPEDIVAAKASGVVHGVKLYPAGATTNSDAGVTSIENVTTTLAKMEEVGMPLLIHGEMTDTDIFDRESAFIGSTLAPLLERFPKLRVVVEHVTTKEMVEFVEGSTHASLGATITPHHLMYSRTDLFKPPNKPGTAFNPHLFCLPVLKADEHREALVRAATSGNPKFFAGTDSAPHLRSAKQSDCCAAGVYAAPVALEAYATVFDKVGALDKLEAFVAEYGARFYGLEQVTKTVTLERNPSAVPAAVEVPGLGEVVPMCAGLSMEWSAVLDK